MKLAQGRDLVIENFSNNEIKLGLTMRLDVKPYDDPWGGIYLKDGKCFQINHKTGVKREWDRY